jgi:hypothetical protein
MKRFRRFILVVVLSIASIAAGRTLPAPPAVPSADSVKVFALQWYTQMQAGKIDRTQYAPAYSALLTDAAVKTMSHHLNEYGASPTRAEIMRSRSAGNQTFYLVKLIFPRGDSASILLGFDAEGMFTAVDVVSMAGD